MNLGAQQTGASQQGDAPGVCGVSAAPAHSPQPPSL